jgi:hypothetical protein
MDECASWFATIDDIFVHSRYKRATRPGYQGIRKPQVPGEFTPSTIPAFAVSPVLCRGEFVMKKFALGLSLAALSISGVAYAAHHDGPDADGDRTVTRAEAQAHSAEMFTKMDANQDGRIDQADRTAHEIAMRNEHFTKLDTNKDGSISRAEFDAAHSGSPDGGQGMGDHRMDGMGMGGAMMGGSAHGNGHRGGMKMMQMADTNKDQAITRDEFTAAHLKHFEMSDANKDGRLTPQERRAAHAKMREQMRGELGGAMSGHDMPPPPPAN